MAKPATGCVERYSRDDGSPPSARYFSASLNEVPDRFSPFNPDAQSASYAYSRQQRKPRVAGVLCLLPYTRPSQRMPFSLRIAASLSPLLSVLPTLTPAPGHPVYAPNPSFQADGPQGCARNAGVGIGRININDKKVVACWPDTSDRY